MNRLHYCSYSLQFQCCTIAHSHRIGTLAFLIRWAIPLHTALTPALSQTFQEVRQHAATGFQTATRKCHFQSHVQVLTSCCSDAEIPSPIPTLAHSCTQHTYCSLPNPLFFLTNLSVSGYCQAHTKLLHSNARPPSILPICNWSLPKSTFQQLLSLAVCLAWKADTAPAKADPVVADSMLPLGSV